MKKCFLIALAVIGFGISAYAQEPKSPDNNNTGDDGTATETVYDNSCNCWRPKHPNPDKWYYETVYDNSCNCWRRREVHIEPEPMPKPDYGFEPEPMPKLDYGRYYDDGCDCWRRGQSGNGWDDKKTPVYYETLKENAHTELPYYNNGNGNVHTEEYDGNAPINLKK